MKTFLTVGTLTIPQETVIFLEEGVLDVDQQLALKLDALTTEIRNELKSQFDLLKEDLLESLGIVTPKSPTAGGEKIPFSIEQLNQGIYSPNDYVLFSVFRNTFNYLDNKIKKNSLEVIEDLKTLKEEVRNISP